MVTVHSEGKVCVCGGVGRLGRVGGGVESDVMFSELISTMSVEQFNEVKTPH